METEFQINGDTLVAKNVGTEFIVKSHPKDYTVSIKKFDIDECDLRRDIFIIDKNVFRIFYKDKPIGNYFLIESSEYNKNLETVMKFVEFLIRQNANKGSKIYAIGGGCVQDIVAFACKIYKRGVPWIFVPTTYLSQVDSCVGGKTALNLGEYKNILGLFSAPSAVIIDAEFVSYIDQKDMFSGLGEYFRLSFTGGKKAEESSHEFVLGVKKAVVEDDEFESCIRMSMNYGHTIGHALEAYFDYVIPHGVAVMIGMIVENRLCNSLISGDLDYIEKFLASMVRAYDGTLFNKLSLVDEDIFKYLKNDKKTRGSKITFAYLKKLGDMYFETLELNEDNKIFILQTIKAVGEMHA